MPIHYCFLLFLNGSIFRRRNVQRPEAAAGAMRTFPVVRGVACGARFSAGARWPAIFMEWWK